MAQQPDLLLIANNIVNNKQMYWMLGERMDLPIGSTDLDLLSKLADKCKGVILLLHGPDPKDCEIVYVGGEGKVLANLK